MVVEELVGKLGFRLSGQSEAQKFIREIERMKKGLKELNRGFKLNFTGNSSGVTKAIREFQQLAAAARSYRLEAERAGRVRFNPRIFAAYAPHGTGGRPGRRGEGVHPGYAGAGYAAARYAPGPAAVAAVGVVATKTFANLETAARELGITAEQARDRVAKDVETFRAQSAALGVSPTEQVGVAKQFAAAGLDYETAIASVVPVVKTAKAAFSDLEPVAEAGIASVNNLAIAAGDLPKAFDIMAKGAKEGQVELKDIAKNLPMVAGSASKLGIKGDAGLSDIVAALEIGRKTAPTGDVAANNLYNLFEKIMSDEVQKAFKKQGIDLQGRIKAGQKKGTTAFDTTIKAVQEYTKGDPFKENELFGDMQARNALHAVVSNWKLFDEMRTRLRTQAAGTVDRDFKEAADRVAGDFEKLSAALSRLLGQLGEWGAPAVREGMKGITSALEANSNISTKNQPAADQLMRDYGIQPLGQRPGTPGSMTSEQFNARFGKGPFGSLTDRAKWGASAGQMPGAINPGALTNRLGADWAKQGLQQTTVNNTTNNTDVGNDQRNQTANVTVNATGLEAVGAAVLANVKAGLSSLGASIAKTSSTPTTTMTAP